MTKDQFINLLRSPATINLNMVKGLEDITERFPYFQNAHLLLAKQYHGHENIRYESYLRKASAYAPDRSVLYRLIKLQTSQIIHIKEETEPAVESAVINIPVNHSENHAESKATTASDIEELIVADEDELMVPDEEIFASGLATVSGEADVQAVPDDPLTIINQRLEEIEKAGKENHEQKQSSVRLDEQPLTAIHKNIDPSPVNIEEQFNSKHEPAGAIDEPPEKKSSEQEQVSEIAKQEEHHSFIEWLKIKSESAVPIETVPDYTEKLKNVPISELRTSPESNLVEKFIKEEPRIVPFRSEFYSPGNMARQSLVEHKDLVSETLAKIYASQGNIRKAIESYQKLSLKFPEKSGYFASLIQNLESGNTTEGPGK
jgi:hypothetical protein